MRHRQTVLVTVGFCAVLGLIGGGLTQPALASEGGHVKETITHAKEGIGHAKEAIHHLEEAIKSSNDPHAKEALDHAK
ncbi:MAG: hypothetical protein NHB36_09745, partial [Nitrospira sp.]|nr:hypothetical protein [Nitrospira sp.]